MFHSGRLRPYHQIIYKARNFFQGPTLLLIKNRKLQIKKLYNFDPTEHKITKRHRLTFWQLTFSQSISSVGDEEKVLRLCDLLDVETDGRNCRHYFADLKKIVCNKLACLSPTNTNPSPNIYNERPPQRQAQSVHACKKCFHILN